jgi:hypothetical protein
MSRIKVKVAPSGGRTPANLMTGTFRKEIILSDSISMVKWLEDLNTVEMAEE